MNRFRYFLFYTSTDADTFDLTIHSFEHPKSVVGSMVTDGYSSPVISYGEGVIWGVFLRRILCVGCRFR